MERPNFIEVKKGGDEDGDQESVHAEAVSFTENHRDFLEHYAKGMVKIVPAPEDLKTFAFNLETDEIFVNSMFYKKHGFSDEKTLFATLHEIEHFMEKRELLSENGGEKKFENYLKKIKKSRAFALMDNCDADIHENRTVISKTNKGMSELEEKIYKEDLFPETDFILQPRHIQFCNTILREARVPDEKCNVSPDVRKALDEIAKVKGLMDIMTNPETPMSLRLKLQDKYIWPKVEALLEKDIEDKKKQKEQEQKQGEGKGKDSGKEEKNDENKEGKNKNGEKDKDKKGGKKDKEKGESKKEDKGAGKPEKNKGVVDEDDPDKIFSEEYDEAEKKIPNAVPIEEIEKAFKEWKEKQKNKDSADKADEEYAQKIGVEKKDLQEYRKIVESLQKIVNPETGVGIIEELRNLFVRIISKRLKLLPSPKYPVEEGDELVDPAQLIADVKAGNLEPRVWEDTEIKEKRGDRFGEVEITLVCDRSGSMTEGQKAIEQRKSAVLVMEVLKEFAEMCEEEKTRVDKPLEIKSEIYSFASSEEDKNPLKKMSPELGEAERINVLKKLYDLPGSTTDFNCLEAITNSLDNETKQKIKSGELKKIVIVFTDGGSDNPPKVQVILKNLRENGVVAVGVGITRAGEPVMSTYAPNALVVEDVQKLPLVLAELLKEHLKNI